MSKPPFSFIAARVHKNDSIVISQGGGIFYLQLVTEFTVNEIMSGVADSLEAVPIPARRLVASTVTYTDKQEFFLN
jgi:hypothetical protein